MINRIVIGADKLGYALKQAIINQLEENGIKVEDVGCKDGDDDTYYPLFAERVCKKLLFSDAGTRGILICGTGIGMSIAANKFKGIAAAICHDAYSCERSILSNNANILCLGARTIDTQVALTIVDKWLQLKFVNGHSTPKLELISKIENRNFKFTRSYIYNQGTIKPN